jgi:hypothetical protein
VSELDRAIAEAEKAGNSVLAAQLRQLAAAHDAADTASGEHRGRRWAWHRPANVARADVWPQAKAHGWMGLPGVAVEIDDDALVAVDAWTGWRFRLVGAFDDDGSTSFVDALRRLVDAMEAADVFAGSAQTGRAGVVRES